jgi:hypothetical protein
MPQDWREWHRAYDSPDSPLSRRLAVVQSHARAALEAMPAGPIAVVSMCAGEARDLVGALDDNPRARDVHGCVVELDPELAARAREHLPPRVDVVIADAGMSTAYEQAVPADLVLVCGVFGNISHADMERTVRFLPSLCTRGGTVIWTRHRRPPDMTTVVRDWLAEVGFDEIAFIAPEDTAYGIGVHRFAGTPEAFRPHVRMFEFVGYDNFASACETCGFQYGIPRAEIMGWLPSDTSMFIEALEQFDDAAVRRRPGPGVWSPLEYACHVRDMLRVQRDRVLLAQREVEPEFVPMRRDERAVEERYNEQDPAVVAGEIREASAAFVELLRRLDGDAWARTGIYNYPDRQSRSVEWIATHTVHELFHHRVDIGTFA